MLQALHKGSPTRGCPKLGLLASRLAPKDLIRKKPEFWKSSAEVRQDPAGSVEEKACGWHCHECKLGR